jgi:hypothetical protein
VSMRIQTALRPKCYGRPDPRAAQVLVPRPHHR